MSKSTRLLLILVPLVAGLALIGAALITGAKPATTPAQAGFAPRPAPDFELKLFSGKTIKLSDFKSKKPVVINFWASWCPPCRAEAPILANISKRFGRQVEFLGVVVNDSQASAEAFVKEFNITYDNGPDPGNVASSYGITGIPETFWINKDGQLVDHWIGAIEETDLVDRTNRVLR